MTPWDITLAAGRAADTSSDLASIRKTLTVGVKFAEEQSDMDADYPLDQPTALDLMATVRTCVLALGAVAASHDIHVRGPLLTAMQRHSMAAMQEGQTDES